MRHKETGVTDRLNSKQGDKRRETIAFAWQVMPILGSNMVRTAIDRKTKSVTADDATGAIKVTRPQAAMFVRKDVEVDGVNLLECTVGECVYAGSSVSFSPLVD
jgi:hypothetical protein